MTFADERHSRIFGKQLKFLAGAVLFLTCMLGLGLGRSITSNQAATERYDKAQELVHTYRVMAGTEASSSVAVSERFAIDMRNLLGSAEGEELQAVVAEFRASANEYGGIDDALGYNPFDNTGQRCEVCGTLNEEMATRLQIIADGNVEALIESELDAAKPSGVPYVGYAIGTVLYLLVTSTGALWFAVRRDCKQHDYEPAELNWKNTGGSVADHYKRLSKILAPGYGVILRVQRARGNDYQATLRKINLDDQARKLLEMRERAEALPPAERSTYFEQLEALQTRISAQVRDFSGQHREFRTQTAERIREELNAELAEIELNVRAREMSKDELDQLQRPSPM